MQRLHFSKLAEIIKQSGFESLTVIWPGKIPSFTRLDRTEYFALAQLEHPLTLKKLNDNYMPLQTEGMKATAQIVYSLLRKGLIQGQRVSKTTQYVRTRQCYAAQYILRTTLPGTQDQTHH